MGRIARVAMAEVHVSSVVSPQITGSGLDQAAVAGRRVFVTQARKLQRGVSQHTPYLHLPANTQTLICHK